MTRRLLPVLGAVLVAGAVAWALTGLPGTAVACLETGCDCEAAGTGPIRQPANAWSSLALAAAGIAAGWQRARHTRLRTLTHLAAATALTVAGAAAFVFHAGLTAWAARLDGIAAAVLVGALLLHGFHRLPRGPGRRGVGGQQQSTAATWARAARSLVPGLLVALGGVCWWLGQNEGPWCRPGSPLQAHAAWHVLAAFGIGLWLCTEKPARTGPQVLPPSSLRAGEPDTP